MRIGILLPVNAVVSFLSICFPATQVYLLPWVDVVQSIAMCTFFLLLCEFASSTTVRRDVFFAPLTSTNKKTPNSAMNGLKCFRVGPQ
jgi:hypothetical protein